MGFQPNGDRELLLELATNAGEIALGYFKSQNAVRYKSGNSPVSEADDAVNEYLKSGFATQRPDYGWLSEETEDSEDRFDKNRIVIVDPIDGTRGFIDGRDEWCISIAIVRDGRPVDAVLHCPAMQRTFLASAGHGLEVIGRAAEPREATSKPLVTGSKKLIEHLKNLNGAQFSYAPFVPSLAYRIAMVAVGELDGAFAWPGASEWDIAAADLILSETGGKITDKHCNGLVYNKPNVRMPALVAGSAQAHNTVLSLAKENGIIQ